MFQFSTAEWLERFRQLDRAHLLIGDELGYVTMSRGGVALRFRVFADRYERGSILVTSNLPFSEWGRPILARGARYRMGVGGRREDAGLASRHEVAGYHVAIS